MGEGEGRGSVLGSHAAEPSFWISYFEVIKLVGLAFDSIGGFGICHWRLPSRFFLITDFIFLSMYKRLTELRNDMIGIFALHFYISSAKRG